MRYSHLGRHLREYWMSLRVTALEDGKPNLESYLSSPVFVINLVRSGHRREYITRHLAGHGLKARIFPAVDGALLDLAVLERQGIYVDSVAHQKFSRSLSPAEVACTLSHVNIYRTMVDEDIAVAMILEDDAMLASGAGGTIRAALEEAPADWDIIQLFHNCEEWASIGQHLVRFPSESRMPVGSAGYLIRKSGAERMLSNSFPVCYPADSFLGRSYRWGMKMYGVVPPIVDQNSVFPTQIYERSSLVHRVKRVLKSSAATITSQVAKALNRLR